MTRTITADQFRALPLDVAKTPRDGGVYTDKWWVASPDGLLFYGFPGARGRGWAPQCNRDRRMGESLIKSYGDLIPGLEVVHMPVVFMGHHDPDYGWNPFRGIPS